MKPSDGIEMDISRQRQKTASIIHTRCMEMINEDMAWSLSNWPLPPPPIYDPEFPPNDVNLQLFKKANIYIGKYIF